MLQRLTLEDPIARVETQQPDGSVADVRVGFNSCAVQAEVRVPGSDAWVAEPHEAFLRSNH
ncbi:MAG: hypothetical protein L0Z50_26320 [Verrucomicrobiales bacterium]|nr:hypothetical protein [Verrucomicrobiales bacterium]